MSTKNTKQNPHRLKTWQAAWRFEGLDYRGELKHNHLDCFFEPYILLRSLGSWILAVGSAGVIPALDILACEIFAYAIQKPSAAISAQNEEETNENNELLNKANVETETAKTSPIENGDNNSTRTRSISDCSDASVNECSDEQITSFDTTDVKSTTTSAKSIVKAVVPESPYLALAIGVLAVSAIAAGALFGFGIGGLGVAAAIYGVAQFMGGGVACAQSFACISAIGGLTGTLTSCYGFYFKYKHPKTKNKNTASTTPSALPSRQ